MRLLFLVLIPLLAFADAKVWKRVFENQAVVHNVFRKMSEGLRSSSYGERAWYFENTELLIGYYSGKWKNYSWDDYVKDMKNLRKENQTLLGILGGFSRNFVVEPDSKLSTKRGKTLAPVFAYKVGVQQLRHAVLSQKRQDLEALQKEWDDLYAKLRSLCVSPYSPRVGNYKNVDLSGLTCGACLLDADAVCDTCFLVYPVADLKIAVVSALEVLEAQKEDFRSLWCAQGFYWLTKAKVSFTKLQGELFKLSYLYGAF